MMPNFTPDDKLLQNEQYAKRFNIPDNKVCQIAP